MEMGVSATIGSPNCNKRLIPTAYGTRARTPSSISFKARPLKSSRIFSNRKHISNQSDDNQGSVPSPDQVDNAGVKVALSLLNFYKREISPLIPRSCRYVPTCSEYSMEAYKKYGVIKGTVLTAWRICRCNPLGGSGFDPPRWFGEEAPPLE